MRFSECRSRPTKFAEYSLDYVTPTARFLRSRAAPFVINTQNALRVVANILPNCSTESKGARHGFEDAEMPPSRLDPSAPRACNRNSFRPLRCQLDHRYHSTAVPHSGQVPEVLPVRL